MLGDNEIKIIISAIDKTKDVLANISSNLEKTGERLSSIGKSLSLKVTAPITAFGALSVKAFGDFNAEIQRAGSYVNATAEQITGFEQVAIQAARGTTYSATEVAKALGSFVGGEIDAQKATKEMGDVVDFALISRFEDLNDAVNISSSMLVQFQKEGLTMKDVVDTMATVASNVTTQTEAYGRVLGDVSAASRSAGFSFKETNVLISSLVRGGARLETIASAVNSAFVNLQAPSDSAREALDAVGLSAEGLSKSLSEGPIATLDYLKQGYDKANESGQGFNFLIDVIGRQAAPEFGMAMGLTGDQLNEVAGYLDNVSGSSEEMLKRLKENISPITQLRNSFEELGISFGKVLVPIITPLIEKLKGLAEWFQGLNPEIQKAIVYGLLFAAALGPILFIAGQLIMTFSILAPVIGLLLGPIGLVILAVGSLALACYLLITRWQEVKGAAADIWGAIQSKIALIMMTIKSIIKTEIDAIKAIWEEAMNWIEEKVNRIQALIERLKSFIGGVKEGISNLGASIGGGIKGLVGYQAGTSFVPETGPYLLHRGEAVLPKRKVEVSPNGERTINITITGNTFVSEEDFAERIGDSIIKTLKFQTRLSL